MTAEEFTKHEENRAELRKVLDTPILRTALAVLKDELEPRALPSLEANPVLAAARYQQMAGANYILKGLEALTEPMKVRKALTPKTLVPEPNRYD